MDNPLVTIIAVGTRGDVQPCVALGKGLQDAGFQVRLATSSNFELWVKQHGLDFISLAEFDPESHMQSEEVKAILESKNPVKMLRGIYESFRPLFHEGLEGMLTALDGADICILSSLAQFGGYDACEKLGVLPILTYLQPAIPMKELGSAFMPAMPNLPGKTIYNRLTHHALIQMLWQLFRPLVNKAREEQLGLEKLPLSGTWGIIQKRKLSIMLGYSKYVMPPSNDWREGIHVPGYWFLDEPNQWSPPPDLEMFLENGEPPIYIGFGSMTNRDPEKNTNIMIEALVKSGERGLLMSGWGGLQTAELPDNILCIESCPHSWLFPHMKAIVHHGGAGTTAAAFRAGKPQIVVPFFADQPFWGRLTHQLGVGVKPLPNKTITAESLTTAMQHVANDDKMQQTASALGEKIRQEDGVGNAVEIVKSIVENLEA